MVSTLVLGNKKCYVVVGGFPYTQVFEVYVACA